MSEIPQNIKLQIGIDGIAEIKFHPAKNTLVVGTVEGRIRIYDCNDNNPKELFRKKWHKNLSKLALPESGSKILTSSSQGCIKEHDFESGKETWSNLNAHDVGISALIYQTENIWISGDDNGILKYWDSRQKDSIFEMNICAVDDECEEGNENAYMSRHDQYLSSINDLLIDDKGLNLFAAMDDGTLVTINARKRKVKLRSETLGYSAKSILNFKDDTKLGVATDEGVISIFNWNQFGNLSDRLPVVKKQQIEKMVKINENVIAVGTNTGAIKGVSILPNSVMSTIGIHEFPVGNEECGDCLTLAANYDCSLIASGCPESNIICFFSTENAVKESSVLMEDRRDNKRKNSGKVIENRKKQKMLEDDCFLDGICEIRNAQDSDDDDDESNDEEIDSIDENSSDEDSD